MKPIALATVALLASTPANAETLQLPNEMLGTWCTTQDPVVEEPLRSNMSDDRTAIRRQMTRRSSWGRAATKART
jgi:hypothetical protein